VWAKKSLLKKVFKKKTSSSVVNGRRRKGCFTLCCRCTKKAFESFIIIIKTYSLSLSLSLSSLTTTERNNNNNNSLSSFEKSALFYHLPTTTTRILKNFHIIEKNERRGVQREGEVLV